MFKNFLRKRSTEVKQLAEPQQKEQQLPAQTTGHDERRRLPRELPVPDVLERDSDSAWDEFQALTPHPGD